MRVILFQGVLPFAGFYTQVAPAAIYLRDYVSTWVTNNLKTKKDVNFVFEF